MNKFQLTVIVGAVINLALALLFPPFDRYPLGRGMAAFDAFYPLMAAPPAGFINTGLLYIEIMAVAFNAALAWLMLQGSAEDPAQPRTRPQSVLQVLVFADLLLILLFPPFEARSLSSFGMNSFDGFGFALAGNIQQGIFLPLLFLELLLLALNAAACWLAFGMLSGGEADAGRIQAAAAPAAAPRSQPQSDGTGRQFGRAKSARRVKQDPAYAGPERRKLKDRRRNPQGPA